MGGTGVTVDKGTLVTVVTVALVMVGTGVMVVMVVMGGMVVMVVTGGTDWEEPSIMQAPWYLAMTHFPITTRNTEQQDQLARVEMAEHQEREEAVDVEVIAGRGAAMGRGALGALQGSQQEELYIMPVPVRSTFSIQYFQVIVQSQDQVPMLTTLEPYMTSTTPYRRLPVTM